MEDTDALFVTPTLAAVDGSFSRRSLAALFVDS